MTKGNNDILDQEKIEEIIKSITVEYVGNGPIKKTNMYGASKISKYFDYDPNFMADKLANMNHTTAYYHDLYDSFMFTGIIKRDFLIECLKYIR